MKPIITHLLRGVKIGSVALALMTIFAPLQAFSNNSSTEIGDKSLPIEIVPADGSLMGFSFTIANATVQKGGELCAQVKVAGFVDILGLEFSLKFDSTKLVFKEVKNFNLAGLTAGTMALPGAGNNPTGNLKVSWFDGNVEGITLPDGTAIFDICFTAINVDATTNIRFVYSEITNGNEQKVAVDNTVGPAVITIGTGGGGGGSGGSLALDIADATASGTNQVACVKVNAVSGATNLKSAQLSINYNTTQLSFSSVKNFNLTGLTAASFNSATPGTLAMNWTSTTPTTGNTLTNGTAVFEVCFTTKLAGITSTLSFASGAQIQNKDNQAVTLNGTTGTITVSGGGGTTGPATFDLTDATGTVGQDVCQKVNVTNFTDLLSAEYTITYNSTQLDFVSVKNFNLAGLADANFSKPGVGTTPLGSIKLSWNDPNVNTGVSVANGTTIFEVCFKPKVNNITSTVTFGSTSEVINKDQQPVTFSGQSGTITVGSGGGGGSTTFTLDLTDTTVPATNQEACIKVNVAGGFTNMVGLEFTINYNTTQLEYSAVKNFNLNGLTEASFGLPGVGTNPAGSIKLSWSDPNVTGITLANGTSIFEVCFKGKVTNVASTVTFATTPAPEAIDKNNAQLPFTGQPGTITIGGSSNLPDVKLNVSSQSGVLAQDVCVKVNVVDFTNISALAGTMTYDATALQFKSVTNLTLAGLTQSSFTPPGTGGVTAGSLRVNWSTATAGGVTLAGTSNIFDVCFTPLKTGTSQVNFSTTGLTLTRSSNSPAVVQTSAGTVTIGTASTSDLTLTVSSASGTTNSDVCLELSTTNFKNVIGMQYAIKFDPAFLTHKSFDRLNAGLRGFSAGSINANNTTGFINLSWVDDQIAGVTLPDNAVIMRMCFTIKGTTGTSTVGIDKTKTVELTDVNEKPIATQTFNGTVSLGTSPNAPSIVSPAVITNVPCFGESKGAINIEVRNGTAPYTYKWSNNATTQDLANIPAGSYNVTVTDASNATAVGTYNVTQPTAALAITGVTKTDANCFGQASGTLTAAVTGGTTPLTYAWSGSLAAVANPTNVPVGSYTLTVTDANGCRAVSSPTAIAQPAAVLNASTGTQPAKCDGTPTGSATITATGGSAPYTYKWANNATTNELSNVVGGSYAFTVTDSKSCTFTGSVTVPTAQSVRITSIDPVNFDQNTATGAVNIAITGGVAPYKFSWVGPNNFTATTEDISNLSVAGQYCVTVTDNTNCTATMCASIVQRLKVNLTVTEACFGQTTGGVSLQATGGVGPYTYKWSNNNATTQSINNIATGNYTVTVTDSQNNSVTGSALVPALTEIKIARTVTDVNIPGGANGAISLTVTGGKPGYTYKWSNNSTTSSLSAVAVGEYCVTVTDLAGCTATGCFKVELVTTPLSVTRDISNNKCNGEAAGVVRLQVLGGAAPYALAFNNGQPENLVLGVFERKNLAAGTYTYKVTDSRNTVFDGSFTVTQPDPLAISSFAVRHDSEDPGCTGSIALSITGGTPGYQVAWNSPNVGFQIINLCEGSFIPSVIDANGCRKTFEPIALTTFTVNAAIVNTSCPDDDNGGVNITVLGGSTPYRYAWLSARGDTISKTKDLGDVAAGVYRLVIRENSGLRMEKQYTVATASKLTANIQILSSFNGFAVSCANAKDGSARATGANGGGTQTYVYEWSLNGNLVASNSVLNNAGVGNYIVRITDGLGCSVEEEVEFKAPSALNVNAFITDVSCIGSRDGELAAEVEGGLTGGKFTYAWSNGRSTPRITGLTKGAYAITITDRNNCTVTKSFEVKEPTAVTVQIQSINATEGCNGQVLALAKGGVKPYTYRWNAPVTSGDSIVKSLCPGEYFVQVTDSRGCKSTPEVSAIEVKDRRLPCMDIRSVISPDGDGSNETFLINCIQEFPGNKIFIYNRWGQLVFQAENYNNDWNGTTQSGEQLPEGAYYYILDYKNAEGKEIQAKGSITLLREE